jgi:hypothetical protein
MKFDLPSRKICGAQQAIYNDDIFPGAAECAEGAGK